MKKVSFILIALGLMLGLAQCKKDKVDPETPVLEGEKYNISVTVGGASKTRADVYPDDDQNIAPVYYEKDVDKLLVVYKGKFVGEITCKAIHDYHPNDPAYPTNYYDASADFEGTITIADTDEIDDRTPLYFYYVGNFAYSVSGDNIIVDISDQRSKLPVISFAASWEAFSEDTKTYTVYNGHNALGRHWLLNQCALVKFTCENIYDMSANDNDNNPDAIYKTTKDITIYGMDNQVTISMNSTLNSPSFTWNQVNNGAIKLHTLPADAAGDGSVRYAIVHHMDYSGVTAGDLDVPYNPEYDEFHPETFDPYGFYGTYKIAHDVQQNEYFDGGKIDLVWHSGAFSISGSGEQVVFSRGNLQYAARGAADPNGTWRFAKHQYDFVGGLCEGTTDQYLGNVVYDENTNSLPDKDLMSDNTQINQILHNGSTSGYNGWIDLFGWGTGNIPTIYRSLNSFYTGTSAYGDNNGGYHEWGANNIVNSGKPGNTSWWITLSKDESKYMIDSRTDHQSKVGFGKIIVSPTLTIHGLILLPDEWHISSYPTATGTWTAVGFGLSQEDWDNNVFNSVSDWMLMEAAGAVFLPAAGYRDTDGYGTSLEKIEYDCGSGTHGENQDRGTYYLRDNQGLSAAWSLAFGVASGDDLLISGLFQDDIGTGDDHMNPKMGAAPDNGRSVRLVHKLSSSKFFQKK